jgi:hypothetical protein
MLEAETFCWVLSRFGLENRRKINQVFNYDIYLPFYLLFILCKHHSVKVGREGLLQGSRRYRWRSVWSDNKKEVSDKEMEELRLGEKVFCKGEGDWVVEECVV